jgi:hypothetical protein
MGEDRGGHNVGGVLLICKRRRLISLDASFGYMNNDRSMGSIFLRHSAGVRGGGWISAFTLANSPKAIGDSFGIS